MIINDPNGSYASVNARNELDTHATTQSQDRRENEFDGSVWSYSFNAINPAGAADNFIYIENTNGSDYVITDIRMWCTSAIGEVKVNLVTGTPSYIGATDVAPVGRNTRYSQTPDITFKTDTDITGLISSGTVFQFPFDVVNKMHHLRTTAGIILGANGKVALQWSAATGELSGTISIAKISAL